MRFWLVALLLGWAAASGAETWRFALIGDTPYTARERREFPAMLYAIGATGVDFVAHIGDIKSGRDRCDDSLFADRKAMFDKSSAPFVFVPGDNDWTDCGRRSNGSYDAVERLAALRQAFWPDDYSLGQRHLKLERQPGPCPEHARFRLGPVLFVTLNVPGSDNNWGEADTPSAEYQARMPWVLDWVKDSFALAKREQLAGIVFLMQADPSFNFFTWGIKRRGYGELLETLRQQTLAFPGQVVAMHGDSHWQRIDKPLRDDSWNTIANFTRVESYGSPRMGWVEAWIDTASPKLFHFQPHRWPED